MLTDEIKPFFTKDDIDQLAKDAGFSQRKSKLDGATFLSLILFYKEDLVNQSLNDLCMCAQHNYNINLKKQSLHERFNTTAVDFLKKVLEKIISKHICNPITEDVQGFTCIRIKDSTSFQVDENAKKEFPGSGGSGSTAAVRIQFEFDMLTGSILDLSVNAYNDQDATNSLATIESVKSNELIIRDLAYMHTSVLRKIIKQEAYFVCRLNPIQNVFEMNKMTGELQPIDFNQLYKKMISLGKNLMELEVFLDEKEPLKIRLILSLLPQTEFDKRIAKIRKQQKHKKRGEPSKDFKMRCYFNLFITNATKKQIPLEKVWSLYKFRWQIELLFKIWKSVWKIEKIKSVIIERLKCYIYSRLIMIMINWSIVWKVMSATLKVSRIIISIDKCNKFLRQIQQELKEMFINQNQTSSYFFVNTIVNKINELRIERHGKKVTLIESFVNWSGINSQVLA